LKGHLKIPNWKPIPLNNLNSTFQIDLPSSPFNIFRSQNESTRIKRKQQQIESDLIQSINNKKVKEDDDDDQKNNNNNEEIVNKNNNNDENKLEIKENLDEKNELNSINSYDRELNSQLKENGDIIKEESIPIDDNNNNNNNNNKKGEEVDDTTDSLLTVHDILSNVINFATLNITLCHK
jgi:hypothetical protein